MKKNSVEDAIDAARREGNLRPLHTLIGYMILKRRQLGVEELNDVRSRVYVSLCSKFEKGQPTRVIANQLGKIVTGAIVDEYRSQNKNRADVPYDDLLDEVVSDRLAETTEDVVIDYESIREIKTVLAQMDDSENPVDRKYHAVIVAKVAGNSIVEAVRRFEPE